ncbi:MAG: hypothetical protein RIS29_2914 [Bacteroidota bacterium]|jgi:pimeloyl-ACP methyl ester carboxylesterase
MKTTIKLIISLIICASFSTLTAQNISGDWNGILKIGSVQLRLVFHITSTANGYSATMDSPDQGAKGIAMSKTTFENNRITIELDAAQIKYSALLIGKDSLSGTFTQAGQSFALPMSRKVMVIQNQIRPQEPSKPYPYHSEEVQFTNKKDNFALAGTFTKPDKGSNFPVVVLISGSAPQNRDEELLGHKPFLIWADYLTRNGIAVLRYDDRGCYESKGDFQSSTTFDFATDVEAAVSYLKTRKDIDASKIGLMGHSEGGLIAPIVAAKNKDIAFVVMLAGPGVSGADILLHQQELIARANGEAEKEISLSRKMNSQIYALVNSNSNNDTLKTKLSHYLNQTIAEHPELKNQKGLNTESLIKQLINPWMLTFIRYNPAPTLEQLRCPVLAVIGSKDLQVPPDINIPAINNALEKGRNKKYTVKELPGLNHLLQECTTGSPNEYAGIEQTISPTALTTVFDWINDIVK